MRPPSSGHLMELLEKVTLAEDQLRSQKLNLFITEDLYEEEKDNWMKEEKLEQLKVHENEKEIKAKESQLDDLAMECNEILKKLRQLESEHKKLEPEIEKVSLHKENQQKKCTEGEAALSSALLKVQEEQQNLMKLNKWTRFLLNKEVKSHEAKYDSQPKNDANRIISEELAKKLEFLHKELIEVVRTKFQAKQERLNEQQNIVTMLTSQCKEIEQKSQELEREIQVLEM